MIQIGQKAPDLRHPPTTTMSSQPSSCRIIWENGWSCAFIPVISPLSEPRKSRRSPKKNAEFEKLGVQVLSVSVDSMFVHKMWVDKELSKMVTTKTVPFPMLSDGGGNIGKSMVCMTRMTA